MSQPINNPPPDTQVIIQRESLAGSAWGGTITQPQLGDPCQKCRKRPSTTQYVGDGGALAFTHGCYQLWCDVCVLTEQLKHARAMARKIPSLEKKLAKAKARRP